LIINICKAALRAFGDFKYLKTAVVGLLEGRFGDFFGFGDVSLLETFFEMMLGDS
jgi:hypothetical protein